LPSFIGVTFSPDAQTLATLASGHIDLWHVVNGDIQQTFDSSLLSTGSIGYALDGQTLVINGIYKGYTAPDSLAIGWDLHTGSQAFSWGAATGRIWAVHPSGVRLQQREFSWEIDLITATTNISIPLSLPSHVSAAAFSPDGSLLAVGDEAGAVQLLQVSDQRPASDSASAITKVANVLQAGAKVISVTFSPDGSLLAARRADGLAHVWRLSDLAPLVHLQGTPDDRLVITSDNQLLISGGKDGVTFYRLSDGKLLRHLDGAVDDIAIGPWPLLLALLHNGQVQLWGVLP
jgi:WD40 repeat protein